MTDRKEYMREYTREYHIKNKDARNAYQREYQKKNRDALKAYQREYHKKNKPPAGSPEAIAIAEKRRLRRLANYDKVREQEKRSREKNIEKHRADSRERMAQTRKEKPEHLRNVSRKSRFKTKYGMSLEDYENMFAGQNNTCAICRSAEVYKWHVDHCHSSNKVRGILCQLCNIMIGHAKDNPETLRRAAEYLDRQQVQNNLLEMFAADTP